MAPTCERKVVRRNNRRQLVLAMQPGDQFEHHLGGAIVQISGRLIRQQDLRLGDERPGQGRTLLLSARKFPGAMV